MNAQIKEFLENNPIGTVIDLEDPDNADLESKIERFMSRDGNCLIETDRRIRDRAPDLDEIWQKGDI